MAGLITDTNKLGGVPQSASKFVAMATCFDVFLDGSKHIGFITQLNIAHTRTVTQIRHLNSVDAGIPVDTVMTPDAITLTFNGFYVYANAANTQGLTDANVGEVISEGQIGVGASIGRVAGIQLLMTLDQQNIPFDIVVRHAYPSVVNSKPGFKVSNANQLAGQIIGAYRNCTISGMTVPINIGTAGVADSGTIVVGYVASKVS